MLLSLLGNVSSLLTTSGKIFNATGSVELRDIVVRSVTISTTIQIFTPKPSRNVSSAYLPSPLSAGIRRYVLYPSLENSLQERRDRERAGQDKGVIPGMQVLRAPRAV